LFLALWNCFHLCAQNAGDLDTDFGTNGIINIEFGSGNTNCRSVALQTDQKLVLFGRAQIDNVWRPTLVRLNTDGSLDDTFGDGGVSTSDLVFEATHHEEARSLIIQPDGKMLCVYCTDFNEPSYTITRFNADGSIDPDFGANGSMEVAPCAYFNRPRSILLQTDGTILVVGIGSNFASDTGKWTAVRFTTEGNLDSTFDEDGTWIWEPTENSVGANDAVQQPNGSILIAGTGYYLTENEVMEFRCMLMRLNLDGSYDETFADAGIGIYDVSESGASPTAVALQADGSILMAGSLITINTGLDALLMRLTPDGDLDLSFGNGGVVSSNLPDTDRAQSMLVMQDGNIMLGGHYYGTGVLVPGLLIKYSADGLQDMTFGNEAGYSTTQNSAGVYYGEEIIQQADGKIVLVGRNVQGGINYFSASRFLISGIDAVNNNTHEGENALLYPNPANAFFTFETTAPLKTPYLITDSKGGIIRTGTTSGQITTVDSSLFENGVYFLHVNEQVVKWIKQ